MWENRWIMMYVGPCEQGTLGNVVLDWRDERRRKSETLREIWDTISFETLRHVLWDLNLYWDIIVVIVSTSVAERRDEGWTAAFRRRPEVGNCGFFLPDVAFNVTLLINTMKRVVIKLDVRNVFSCWLNLPEVEEIKTWINKGLYKSIKHVKQLTTAIDESLCVQRSCDCFCSITDFHWLSDELKVRADLERSIVRCFCHWCVHCPSEM